MNANELGGLMAEIIFRTDDKQTSEVLKALDSIKLGSDVQGDLKKIRWEIINEAIYYKSGAMYYMIQKVCQEQNSSDGIYLQQAYMDVLVHICDNSDPEKIYWLNSDILKERTAKVICFFILQGKFIVFLFIMERSSIRVIRLNRYISSAFVWV